MTEKTLGTLVPINLHNFWLDEAKDFTPWLAKDENLELLSSTLGIELEKEGVAVAVGPYRADIVARDVSSDTRAIMENQLEKTDHDHLGKAITYASGLDATILIWIAKELSEEHRRAFNFINENAAPNLRCFGVEIQLWKINNSRPAPSYKVISSPNEYTWVPGPKELTETKSLYLEFWNSFKEFCSTEGTFPGLRKPCPQHWYSIAVGRSKFSINVKASVQRERLGCEIYIRGPMPRQLSSCSRNKRTSLKKPLVPYSGRNFHRGKTAA